MRAQHQPKIESGKVEEGQASGHEAGTTGGWVVRRGEFWRGPPHQGHAEDQQRCPGNGEGQQAVEATFAVSLKAGEIQLRNQ